MSIVENRTISDNITISIEILDFPISHENEQTPGLIHPVLPTFLFDILRLNKYMRAFPYICSLLWITFCGTLLLKQFCPLLG